MLSSLSGVYKRKTALENNASHEMYQRQVALDLEIS